MQNKMKLFWLSLKTIKITDIVLSLLMLGITLVVYLVLR